MAPLVKVPQMAPSLWYETEAERRLVQVQGFNVIINNRCFVSRCARPLLLGNEMLVKLSYDGIA
jgi:hypothetical protein